MEVQIKLEKAQQRLNNKLEKFEELKKELYKKESERDNDRIYDESIDLLATVFRLVLDNDLYKLRLDFKYDPSN